MKYRKASPEGGPDWWADLIPGWCYEDPWDDPQATSQPTVNAELLEALRGMVELWEYQGPRGSSYSQKRSAVLDAEEKFDRARTAIAKATEGERS